MAYTNTTFYHLIASAIRTKLDVLTKYYPNEMASAISEIELRNDGLNSLLNGDYLYYGHLIIDYDIGITDDQNFTDMADAIRGLLNTDSTYTPEEIPFAIFGIPSITDLTGEYPDGDFIQYGEEAI